MTDHTQTPWHLGNEGTLGGWMLIGKQGPLNVCPATAHGLSDAEFILRAVNSYDAMLAALKHAMEAIAWYGAGQFEMDGMTLDDRIEAALALAEKED